MHYISETARKTHVVRNVDVLVAGGGIAGVAAALAAARTGAKTLIIEKECALGGLATLGLVVMFLPLCDGYGHQVIGGISEELLRKSIKYGNLPMHEPWRHIPSAWDNEGDLDARIKKRFRVDFDAAPMMLVLEQLLIEAGVEIWYDSRLCAAVTEAGRLNYAVIENKSGRLALGAKAFVDATGDADLCFMAGENTVSSDQNRKSGWYFSASSDGDIQLHPLSDPLYAPCPEGSCFYSGDRGSEVSTYIQNMHAMILEHATKNREAIPFLIPTTPLFRMTRRLKAREDLTPEQLGRWKEDAIAQTGDWRKPAPVYTIGLRNIQGRNLSNLYAAGRCIGAAGDAWDVTRVIPTCGATGQAAGTAAALHALNGSLVFEDLRQKLISDGMIMDKSLTIP